MNTNKTYSDLSLPYVIKIHDIFFKNEHLKNKFRILIDDLDDIYGVHLALMELAPKLSFPSRLLMMYRLRKLNRYITSYTCIVESLLSASLDGSIEPSPFAPDQAIGLTCIMKKYVSKYLRIYLVAHNFKSLPYHPGRKSNLAKIDLQG